MKPSYPSYFRVVPSQSALLRAALLCAAVAVAILLLAFGSIAAQHKLSATEAKDHIGDRGTVCGKVVSTRYAVSTRGQPTFLNLDTPYPQQIFTVVIWGSNRAKFGRPESDYKDKRLCVTGTISAYRGVPEIVANDPRQVRTDD